MNIIKQSFGNLSQIWRINIIVTCVKYLSHIVVIIQMQWGWFLLRYYPSEDMTCHLRLIVCQRVACYTTPSVSISVVRSELLEWRPMVCRSTLMCLGCFSQLEWEWMIVSCQARGKTLFVWAFTSAIRIWSLNWSLNWSMSYEDHAMLYSVVAKWSCHWLMPRH